MEIKQEEAAFRRRLNTRLSAIGFVQNIENTISSGVPDVYFEINRRAIWLELKVVFHASPLVRKEQRVWMHRHSNHGGLSGILALDTREDRIDWYPAPIAQVLKSGRYLRVLDLPEESCDWRIFRGNKIISMLKI